MSGFNRLFISVLLLLMLTACQEVAYKDLDERQVNEMIAVLDGHGIAASKRSGGDDGYELSVERGEFANAVRVLREQGYPRERFADVGQVFEKSGLLSSPMEERARYVYALSQSVAETISRIDGVITARVHLVMPDNNPFAEDARPSSAAVLIKYHPDVDMQAVRSDIQLLVQKSIEGLSYEGITMVLLPAQELATTRTEAAPVAAASVGGPMWLSLMSVVAIVGGGAFYWLGQRLRRGSMSATTALATQEAAHEEQHGHRAA
ncbi:type III secretion protein J [Natronocella acetinitrilica]|jgi:type III secretion protein J|uniref:Lipoprotein n=1 Tax=Natronocella acetinitrilica TaxID=414046 RepID=A0AAE3G558_9GAMM|nr:type III secretion inner membrane ring lipoprotein SctJ [Natronocella acetinitrilica]MCP1675308.1 type III secretion protein J [Natronocella acetinitrilica]